MNAIEAIILENDTLWPEEYFQKSIVLERKKTGRSGRPFMVLLLDISQLLQVYASKKDAILNSLTSALNESTREIDVKGWYRRDAVLGVICTEVNVNGRDAVVAKIWKKLDQYFQSGEEQCVRVSVLFYPEYENATQSKNAAMEIEELMPERRGIFFS